jgi:hypothetical protein
MVRTYADARTKRAAATGSNAHPVATIPASVPRRRPHGDDDELPSLAPAPERQDAETLADYRAGNERSPSVVSTCSPDGCSEPRYFAKVCKRHGGPRVRQEQLERD